MCLYIEENQTCYTNKKDIITFKVFSSKKNILNSKLRYESYSVISEYYNFEYIIGKLYKTNIEFKSEGCAYDVFADEPSFQNKNTKYIGNGFHSAYSVNRLTMDNIKNDKIIYECIIPKDSQIHFDSTGLLVSNSIIVSKHIQCDEYVNDNSNLSFDEYINDNSNLLLSTKFKMLFKNWKFENLIKL